MVTFTRQDFVVKKYIKNYVSVVLYRDGVTPQERKKKKLDFHL